MTNTAMVNRETSFLQGGNPAAGNQRASKPLRTSERNCSFTKSQLSLALAIARSKPTDLSTRDYCLLLRKHVKLGRTPPREDRRYIDSAEFWKDQYSKLHQEKVGLEGEAARLEQLICQLEDKPTQRQASNNTSKGPKRRVPTAELRTPNGPATSQSSPKLEEPEFIDCLALLKQTQSLHELIGDNDVSTEVLLKAVLLSISCLGDVVSGICNSSRFWSEITTEAISCRAVRSFNIAAPVFNLCLKGLAHLCRDISGRRSKGQIIYSLVQCFTTSLRHLHELCVQELLPRSPTKLYQPRARRITTSPEANGVSALATELSKFLANILASPEFQKADTSNAEVLEGLFSSLLTQIGGLISQKIFQKQLASSKRPGRICSNNGDVSTLQNLAVDLEGHRLVYVLKRALGGKNEKERPALSKMLTSTKLSSENPGEGPLSTRAKRRLQETLLEGIFGPDGNGFISVLKMPQFEEGWEREAIPTDQEKEETFVESVWALIGWDLVLKP